ncbi:hypothetical protein SAMN05421594_1439 [Chryseobacterium oleae]|uniref:Uncharacterized protein n=1 Tax=Chryseobacterium oleae TaxID=491207 RepID=A0A1I4WRM0_CHROL|nr:hypothetical protein [Chryseobacterium oleae]SFN15813.1 hypothetical protein SAMN05421594_1439 [Chryseobacterium oleae]
MIDFSQEDKELILSAFEFEKETLSKDEYEKENLTIVYKITHELGKQDPVLSKEDLDLIIEYLGILHHNKTDYTQSKVLELERRIKDWNKEL